ncbi:uncharacterized protein LOC141852828 [Brevipalpus obovatus]|uniref:uncharacterized protein LOC141852828 n=1 Tax=Brevipalpus obovatus TaxID=246614 RepID=UPI003D9E19B2
MGILNGNDEDNRIGPSDIEYSRQIDPSESESMIMTSKSPREEMIQDIDKVFSDFRDALLSLDSQDDEIDKLTDQLHSSIGEMMKISKNYEYHGLPVTGFVMHCLLIRDFLRYVLDKGFLNKSKPLNDVKTMMQGFQLLKELLVHMHQTQMKKKQQQSQSSINDDDGDDEILSTKSTPKTDENFNPTVTNDQETSNLCLFPAGEDETVFQLSTLARAIGFQEVLHREFGSFWLTNKTTSNLLSVFRLACGFSYKGFLRTPRLVLSKKYRARCYVRAASTANIRVPFDSAHFLDSHISRKCWANICANNSNAIGKNFWIPAQSRWIVPENGGGIIEKKLPEGEKKLVRCRLVRPRPNVINPDGIVIFHCHGSGFVITRPEVHDVYLKKWVTKLGDVPVVSVDYALRAKYPRQFQDTLDAYLWLISGDKMVEDILGFHPKKLIFIGDSAGGMLVMSNILLINEIRRKCPEFKIIMPDSIVTFYSAFWLNAEWSSSKIMSIFDPLLHYGNILAIAGCFSGVQGSKKTFKNPPKNRLVKVSRYAAEDMRSIKRISFPRRMDSWYLEDGRINAKMFRQVHSLLESPYVTCPKYDRFDDLKDIELCLVTTFGCIFLDDNIEMAKAWKGPIELHALEGLEHGFLFLPFEREAHQFSLEKVQQVINKSRSVKKSDLSNNNESTVASDRL